jgi:hypothetical protein
LKRRFIKPRFFLQFFQQPSGLSKNLVCKKISDVVNLPLSKLIHIARAFFTALFPDSYVVINCNGIHFLFVSVIEMHEAKRSCLSQFVVAGFFIKNYPLFRILANKARKMIFTAFIR